MQDYQLDLKEASNELDQSYGLNGIEKSCVALTEGLDNMKY
jgi:hypothetical protein